MFRHRRPGVRVGIDEIPKMPWTRHPFRKRTADPFSGPVEKQRTERVGGKEGRRVVVDVESWELRCQSVHPFYLYRG